jgi:hypothetical protein
VPEKVLNEPDVCTLISESKAAGMAQHVGMKGNGEAGLSLVQQGDEFAYRQYLKQCDEWAYLDREGLAQRFRLGVWRFDGGIQRPKAGPQRPCSRK